MKRQIHKTTDFKTIIKYNNFSWNKSYLSYSSLLTVSDIDNPITEKWKGEWNWYDISHYINIQEVINNPNKPWDRYSLSFNKGITLDIAENLVMPYATHSWLYEYFICNENPVQFYNKTGAINIMSPNITYSLLLQLMYPIDWTSFSTTVNISEVWKHPSLQWDKVGLSCNKQLTINLIDNLVLPNAVNDWDWDYISQSINIQEVINNPNKPWSKKYLSANEDITYHIVNYLSLPNATDEWADEYLYELYDFHSLLRSGASIKYNNKIDIEEAFILGIFERPKPDPKISPSMKFKDLIILN